MSSTHAHITGDKISKEAMDEHDDDISELICENGSI
ncbi:unnamed protein product, partial [Adineta steineri]